jgi:hypothetical protein
MSVAPIWQRSNPAALAFLAPNSAIVTSFSTSATTAAYGQDAFQLASSTLDALAARYSPPTAWTVGGPLPPVPPPAPPAPPPPPLAPVFPPLLIAAPMGPQPISQPAWPRPESAAIGVPRAPGGNAERQMAGLLTAAERGAGGCRPEGNCYQSVWGFIKQVGYGNMPGVDVPAAYSAFARNFAEYANMGNNAERMGIRRLPIDNPYLAPPGAIVVVRAGTPGTHHKTAGDITVAAGAGRFLNDGEMGYGGSKNFPPGNDYVLGIYVPV